MSLLRRFRAPLIGIAALVVSASVAFAAAPTTPGAAGLAKAASHAGQTVPVTPTADQTGGQDEATDTEDTTDTGDTGDTSSSDHCNVDLTQDPSVLAGLNHGSVVCTAAQQEPPGGYSPTGFANHGAWVSSFAKGSHGSNQSATGKSHKPSH